MTHDITFQGSTTIICILKWNWKLVIKHTQKDNFSVTELLLHITNPRGLAYNRTIISSNSLGLRQVGKEITYRNDTRFFPYSQSFTHIHRTEVQVSIVPPQCTGPSIGDGLQQKASWWDPVPPYSGVFWRGSRWSYLYQICEKEVSFKIRKTFPDLLNLHFASGKESQDPAIKKVLFSSPLMSRSISILHIFPSSVSIIPSLLYIGHWYISLCIILGK